MKRFTNYKSLIVLLVIVFSLFHLRLNNFPGNVFAYDTFGFYSYLPSLIINGDIGLTDFSKIEQVAQTYNLTPTFYQFTGMPEGGWVIRFFSGISILFLPFFLFGHLFALNSSFPADGYSLPYQWSFVLGGIFYTIMALWFARKTLQRFFSDGWTALILALFFFGSNFFFFSTIGNKIPHVIVFFEYAVIIWLTILWHDKKKMLHAGLLGFFIGFISISRSSEIISVFIPLLWGVTSWNSAKEKLRMLWEQKKHVLLFAMMAIVGVLPQIFYWKTVTGSFVFNAYNDPQSGLNLLSPDFIKVLFGFRKGLFIYSPLMFFAYLGLIVIYFKKREIFWPILVVIFINTYLIASFSSLVSYGWRAFVQSYAVLILPLGFFIHWVYSSRKMMIKLLFSVLLVGIVLLNIFQSWQVFVGIIDGSRMTKDYYFATFGKTSVTDEDRDLLLISRSFTGEESFTDEYKHKRELVYKLDFERPNSNDQEHYSRNIRHSGKFAVRLDSTFIYSPGKTVRYNEITDEYYAWLRVSAYVYPTGNYDDLAASLVVHFDHKGAPYKYRAFDIKDKRFNLKMNQWNKITVDYLTPEVRLKSNNLKVYLWLRSKNTIYLDDLTVEAFEPLPKDEISNEPQEDEINKADELSQENFIYNNSFEELGNEWDKAHQSSEYAVTGQYSMKMDSVYIYSPGLKVNLQDIENKKNCKVEAKISVFPMFPASENPGSFVINFKRDGQNIQYSSLNLEDIPELKTYEWNTIAHTATFPDSLLASDKLEVYYWHRGKEKILLDDLKVELKSCK